MISRKAMLMVAATLFTLPLAEAVTVLNSTISSTRLLSPISSGFKSSGFNSSITRKPTPASSIRGSSFATTRFNSSTYPSSIDCKIQSEISIEELLIMIRPNISLMSEPETLAYLALLGEELYTVGSLFEEAGTLSAKSQMFTDKVAYTSILSSIQVKANKVITRALGPNGDAVLAGFSYVANACLFSTCTNQYSSQSSVVVAGGGNWDGVWAYIPQSPCCGACTIYGDGVEISYWPTPAPTPAIETLVDEANHTLVSPSVYVAFTQLYAQNRCGQVGSNVMLTTLAFDPQDLSTSSMTGTNTGLWTAINYAELAATRCICTTNCSIETFFGTITNTCTPQMSIPTKVSALISEWKSCFTNYGGIFDPPVVLSPGKGLTLPKATDPKPTPDNNNPNTPLPIVAGPAPAPASPIPPGPIQTPAPPQSNPSLNLNPLIESQNLNPQPSPIPPNNPSQQENTPQNLASLLNNPSLNPNPPTGPQTLNPQPNPNPPNNPPQENNPQNPTTISNNPTPNNPSEPAPQQSSILPSNPLPPSNNAQPMNNVPSSQNNLQQGQSSVILALGPSVTMMMVNGQELTANPQGNFVVGSQTLVPGGPPITMDNSPSSSALPMGSGTPESHPQVAAIGGQSITTNSQGNFVVGGQTITPGGPTVTIAGTPVSIPIGATQVIVGATIIPVNTAIIPIVVLTINEQPITANGQGNFVIGTQTLTPGGSAVTISGTPISIGPGMTQGVVGGTTTSLRVIIDSFLTTANAPSNTPTPAQYTGGVDQGIRGFSTRRAFAGLVMSLFMMWL